MKSVNARQAFRTEGGTKFKESHLSTHRIESRRFRTRTPGFKAVLFATAKRGQQPQRPRTDNREILLNCRKEGKSDTCYDAAGPWGHHAE